MKSKPHIVIYAFSAFVVFLLISWLLRLAGGKLPVENGVWGVFKESDFLLALIVSVMITFSHIQKRKLKK